MAVGEPDLLGQLLTQITTAGPVATILFVVLYLTNKERKEAYTRLIDTKDKHAAELAKLVEGTTTAVNTNNTVLSGIESKLGSSQRRQPAVRRRGSRR